MKLTKFFTCLFFCFWVAVASSIFLPDLNSDTLTAEQKLHITNLVQERRNQDLGLGIIGDARGGNTNNLSNLSRIFMEDSLEIAANAIIIRYATFLPSLNIPLQPVRPLITEIFSITNLLRTDNFAVLLDDGNATRNGDTINVPDEGFAIIRHNNNYRITLHPNTRVVIARSHISLIEGELSISLSDNIFPDQATGSLRINTTNGNFNLNGSAFISSRDTTVMQLYSGTAIFGTDNRTQSITEGNAMLVFWQEVIDVRPIPTLPQFPIAENEAILPGDPVIFANTSAFHQRLIIADEENNKIADTIINVDTLNLMLDYGKKQFFLQDIDTLGIFSDWAHINVDLQRKSGLKSLEIFSDTLFYTTDHRFFTFNGVAETSVRVFVNYDELTLSQDGNFSHRIKLQDELNHPDVVILYRDLSADTVSPAIFYTGFDERITMNDLIMDLPAFTVSRTYKWRGTAPTATRVSVNGLNLEIGEDGFFERTLRTRAFINHPVIMEIDFENGNSKVFERHVSRKRYTSSGEIGFREAMISVVAALCVGSLLATSLLAQQR
ncbi:MAG: hypothetical protein FWE23_05165 [Chitinivibrionia bacterium]|nr:hypothetical protein [Chitinivibrionia bacterium]